MGKSSIIPDDQKINAIISYLNGTASLSDLSMKFHVDKTSINEWIMKYKTAGETGLIHSSKTTHYPVEIKIEAVEEYLTGLGSQYDICVKYHIACRSVLRKWIKKYNGHEEMKSQNSTGGKIMINGRKTTCDERVAIVAYCLDNNENFHLTSEKYQVSYQQVYTWVRKYQQDGLEALIDGRGKRKSPDSMTETEKAAAQIKLLEIENKRLRMENGFLKKLKEVERRRAGKINI